MEWCNIILHSYFSLWCLTFFHYFSVTLPQNISTLALEEISTSLKNWSDKTNDGRRLYVFAQAKVCAHFSLSIFHLTKLFSIKVWNEKYWKFPSQRCRLDHRAILWIQWIWNKIFCQILYANKFSCLKKFHFTVFMFPMLISIFFHYKNTVKPK